MKQARFLILALLLCAMACDSESADAPEADPPETDLAVLVVETAEQAQALPAEIEGDLVLSGPELSGVLTLHGLRKITGRLSVSKTVALERLVLPELEHVAGAVWLEANFALVGFEAAQLAHVGALGASGNPRLSELALPALREARSVSVSENPALARLSLPQLTLHRDETMAPTFILEPAFVVSDNLSLEVIEAPRLAQADELRIRGQGRLRALELPSLTQVGSLTIRQNHRLESLQLPALVEACSEAWSSCVIDVPWLSVLELPSLTTLGNDLSLRTPSLRELELPVLTALKTLWVHAQVLERFSAPELQRIDAALFLHAPHVRDVALTKLELGCDAFSLPVGAELPACAAESVAPLCEPEALSLRQGCSCDPQGDLSLAVCPAVP